MGREKPGSIPVYHWPAWSVVIAETLATSTWNGPTAHHDLPGHRTLGSMSQALGLYFLGFPDFANKKKNIQKMLKFQINGKWFI